MTVAEFIAKWRKVELKERSAFRLKRQRINNAGMCAENGHAFFPFTAERVRGLL